MTVTSSNKAAADHRYAGVRVTPKVNGVELCLKFTDTVDWRTSNHAKDTLRTYLDLVGWSQRRGVIDQNEANRLLKLFESREMIGEETLKHARVLRESIYAIFSAVAHGRKASAADLAMLNGYLGRAMAKMEVKMTQDGYRLGWCSEVAADRMLYPVAKSAAELLTSDDLQRVKECANEEEGCGSLFLDNSKSHSRRWCSMDTCGNKAKVRAYYHRHVQPPTRTR